MVILDLSIFVVMAMYPSVSKCPKIRSLQSSGDANKLAIGSLLIVSLTSDSIATSSDSINRLPILFLDMGILR